MSADAPEAMADLDADGDGEISKKEMLDFLYKNSPEGIKTTDTGIIKTIQHNCFSQPDFLVHPLTSAC